MRISTKADYSVWVKYFLAAFLVLGIDFLGWFGGIHSLGDRMLNPISSGVRKSVSAVGNPVEMARFVYRGPGRITDLERRLSEALVTGEEADVLREENTALRKLLGHAPLAGYDYRPVSVVGGGDELVISAGKVDGVNPGVSVVDGSHVLLGKVVRVSAFTSWIQTNEYDFSVVPVVVGQGNLAGILQNGKIEIQQSDNAYVGDRVITSGVKGEYVPGILVGTVVSVEEESAEIYKQVGVEYLGSAGDSVFLVEGKL